MTVFTIGFTKRSAKSFFGALKTSGARRLLDIRRHKTSQLAGFTKRDDLEYFLQEIAGMEYYEVEPLAPEDRFLKEYRETHNWDTFERRYQESLERRLVATILDRTLFENDVVLLCSEPKADRCHRRLAAEFLVAQVLPGASIAHL